MYSRRVTIRFRPEEYDKLEFLFKSSACLKLADYMRKTLLRKPVVITYRNQSADEFLQEMIQLKKELNAIGNNFNQSVKRLHTLDTIPEIKTWLLLNEPIKQAFIKKVEEIRLRMNQLYEQWSQK
jgi:MobC-like protein